MTDGQIDALSPRTLKSKITFREQAKLLEKTAQREELRRLVEESERLRYISGSMGILNSRIVVDLKIQKPPHLDESSSNNMFRNKFEIVGNKHKSIQRPKREPNNSKVYLNKTQSMMSQGRGASRGLTEKTWKKRSGNGDS